MKYFILSFILFVSPATSFGLPADDVFPLVDEEYFPHVYACLGNAKDSIFCVMYSAKLDPKYKKGWEYKLVNALIDAKNRGVSVTVIFDQNVMFWEKQKKAATIERKSQNAYELLKENGVSVFYDDKDRVTHNKILVIDNEITILGSTNWTYSALKKNHESSVIIKSKTVAETFLNSLKKILAE